MESVVGRAEGSAKSPLKTGVSSSREVTTLRCTPLAVVGFRLNGPSVAAFPGGSTIWPARAFGSIGVFRGPVDGEPAADGQPQATGNRATTPSDSPSTERRIRLILDSMRPNDMRTPGGAGIRAVLLVQTRTTRASTVPTGVVPRLLTIGLIERDGKVVLLRRSRLVRGDVDELRHAGQLGCFVPRRLAELEATHVRAPRRDGAVVPA